MATRPSVSIEWGTGSIPAGPAYTLTQQQNGYAVGQQPTAQGDNGWQNGVYQWQSYLDSNLTNTTTAAGTTTLTAASDDNQRFSGSSTQTVKLPDETTLAVGRRFRIWSTSTGAVTIQDSAAGALFVLAGAASPGAQFIEFVSVSAGAATGNWRYFYSGVPGQQQGIATNTGASTGCIGETLSISRVASNALSMTSGQVKNVGTTTHITITPGRWRISAAGYFTSASTSGGPAFTLAVSKTSATLPASDTLAVPTSGEMIMQSPAAGADTTTAAESIFFVYSCAVSTNTDLYLVGTGNSFGSGSATVCGSLFAERL